MGDQKNLFLAFVLSLGVILLWDMLVVRPQVEERERVAQIERAAVEPSASPSGEGAGAPGIALATRTLDRTEALATSDRVTINSARVDGSIALLGGRIDDINLKDYRVTVDKDSDEVAVLSPAETDIGYYALFGWTGKGAGSLPGPATEWSVAKGSTLSAGQPVVLTWENEAGLVFEQEYAIDEDYLFTVTQTVRNGGGEAIELRPYGLIARHGTPKTEGMFLLHEGAIGGFDGITENLDYDDFEDFEVDRAERARLVKFDAAENGWIGFTGKYWMTALIPEQGTPFTGAFKLAGDAAVPVYTADTRIAASTIAPGDAVSRVTHFFAGAKEASLLGKYEESLGAESFYDAIDWGWFYFLTKPFFWLLHTFYKLVGNFGVAIILLTVVIKAVMFPLAYKSYVSMAKLKNLQPETEKLREKHSDDPQAMQKAMMELYKKEKVNPAAGCLPILVQIPVFFALYKVLYVTLEMRHQPFFGWIKDLSAPDPTSFLNLFGLLPWDIQPGSLLALIGIGVFPLIMGITMWIQMQLNPQPPDPMQRKLFQWMPVLFTFMLGTFPVGLVIYWTANNVLTIIQQASIMKSQGAKIELMDNLRSMFGKEKKAD